MDNYDKAKETESMIFDMSTGLLTYTSMTGNHLSVILKESLRNDVLHAIRNYDSSTPLHREIINSMFLRLYA